MTLSLQKLEQWVAVLRADLKRKAPGSAAAYAEAVAFLPGGLTRHILFFPPHPIYWKEASDSRLVDVDGNEYVDFCCEYTAGLYGHSNSAIMRESVRVISEGIARGGPTKYEAKFARILCKRFGFEAVRFSNSGTEANLIALGLAKEVSRRNEIVVFEGAYHGGVLDFDLEGGGALNVREEFRIFPYNGAEVLQYLGSGADVAAVLVEPMLSSGGCVVAEREWIKALMLEAQRRGSIVVVDEVMTSRLAPSGLQGEWGIRPDLTTLGKYLGGGYTLSAIGGKTEILGVTDVRRANSVEHHGTFNNNVLAISAGLVGLRDEFTASRCRSLNDAGEELRKTLNEVAAGMAVPFRFRGIGSIMSLYVEEVRGRSFEWRLREALFLFCALRGVFIGTIALINLALSHVPSDLRKLVESVESFAGEIRIACAE